MQLNVVPKVVLTVFMGFAVITGVISGAIWVSNIDNRKAAAQFPLCTGSHAVHRVVIRNDKVVPAHTDAKRCDTLVITNMDDKPRVIAFGVHDRHVAYDGVTERYLSYKGTFQVKLIQPGKNFLFHDHEQDEVQGTFSITQ